MARPFRHQPPVPVREVVHRRRLLEQLAGRWDHRLVTVVAGPGFGKTMLLVDAMSASVDSGGDRRDVWMACEPDDESARSLIFGLRAACGLRPNGSTASLCRWVWTQAPIEVCLVLDDLHEIGADSAGFDVIRELLADLPRNGHLMVASRAPVALNAARLAAAGQLVRVTEAEMLFDAAELDEFATTRGVSTDLTAASGGWPALAELLASAGEDLVIEYLWDEVLQRIGPERARQLALFHAVGGGDDEIVQAITGETDGVEHLVAGLPLIAQRASEVVLHPLWGPPLRGLVADEQVDHARVHAAAVHLRAGRFDQAIQLQLDAEAWDAALATIRHVAMGPAFWAGHDQLGRWRRALPPAQRARPEALLAAGLEQRAHDPKASLASFAAAASGFAVAGDLEGELAAIGHEGTARWWANDFEGMLPVFVRLQTLVDNGSTGAAALVSIGNAAIAQSAGDADGVLAALDGADARLNTRWLPVVGWLRSVARRQVGDLHGSRQEMRALAGDADETLDRNQLDLTNWRTDWLTGEVEAVCAQLRGLCERYRTSGDQFFYVQTVSELSASEAWLGRSEDAVELLAATAAEAQRMPGSLLHVLRTVATAAIAVDRGADDEAAAIVRGATKSSTFGADRWYWRDRGATALLDVLGGLPRDDPRGPSQLSSRRSAEAMLALRRGDTAAMSTVEWPSAGVARVNLPHRWLLELCAAGIAAGNPPPAELLELFGDEIRATAARLAASSTDAAVRRFEGQSVKAIPPPPDASVAIAVLGPLELRLDDEVVDHTHLHRQRVRELLTTLVVRRKLRREQVAVDLWPELTGAGHNLRVTLNYLQQLLQPTRPGRELPYFVRTEGDWLTLVENPRITVDLWTLNGYLDAGERADREREPQATIEMFRAALPLWRGDPLGDLPDVDWAWAERTLLIERYSKAATRTAELELAAGREVDAIASAAYALRADRTNEAAHRVDIRARLGLGDVAGAVRALAGCRVALATLGLAPHESTITLLEPWGAPAEPR